jgi:hypothetical protein
VIRLTPQKSKIVPLTLAGALLVLAIPQTTDAILKLYADREIQLADAEGGNGQYAAKAVALLQQADNWFDDPEARLDIGLFESELSGAAGAAIAVDGTELTKAVGDLTSGLARSPANAQAWAVLAKDEIERGDVVRATSALRTSLLFDPYNPALAILRCGLGLRLWPSLDNDNRRLIGEQLEFAWDQLPTNLVLLAKVGNYLPIISGVFAADPSRQAEFLKAVR